MTDLQVKCFLEVARCLNFTKAAKNLFISQSNISRQIASFEEEICQCLEYGVAFLLQKRIY